VLCLQGACFGDFISIINAQGLITTFGITGCTFIVSMPGRGQLCITSGRCPNN
jgi:hypothetical protein